MSYNDESSIARMTNGQGIPITKGNVMNFTQSFLDDITPVIIMEIHEQEPSIHSRNINAFVAGYFAAKPNESYSVDEIVKQFFRWWHNWL